MAEFKDMLIYLRKRSGLTQAELSKRTGLSRSSIANYESGLRRPKDDDKEVLADFFNVSIDTLLGRPTEQKEQPTELGELSPIECDLVLSWRSSDATTRSIISKILDLDEKEPIGSLDAV